MVRNGPIWSIGDAAMPTPNVLSWTKIKLAEDLKQYLKHQAVDNGRSLAQEINERLERTRQIEAEALRKLRSPALTAKFRDFL